MTYARAHLVDSESEGFYHCISRCVRRAWLCGRDPVTGRSFEHRRRWIEKRALYLASVFAIDLFSYAVMSNHYHLVVRLRPGKVETWSDEKVARRWCKLLSDRDPTAKARAYEMLLARPEALAIVRRRLSSISWFMRYLNEPLARIANKEDGCTGRFWEGRFKSHALLDHTAVLAAMVYVDLNPWRAGLVDQPGPARYTSAARRTTCGQGSLAPLADIGIELRDYLALLCWTARPSPGSWSRSPASRYENEEWARLVAANRWKFRAYGTVEQLSALARSMAQRWLKGFHLREANSAVQQLA